jgi:PhnB protein
MIEYEYTFVFRTFLMKFWVSYEPFHSEGSRMTNMPVVIPMLNYEDGPAAMDWLAAAFGFQEITRLIGSDGLLAHGEMAIGNGRIMLSTATPAYESPKHHREHCTQARAWSEVPYIIDGVLVFVDNIDRHYDQAIRMGAIILSEVEDAEPGRRYRVEDPEGHRWMFIQRPSTQI